MQPGLPDWPFSGQTSEIWPRFKLVGLKNFCWLFGFFWPHLKLADLKKFVWHFGSYLAFFTLK